MYHPVGSDLVFLDPTAVLEAGDNPPPTPQPEMMIVLKYMELNTV